MKRLDGKVAVVTGAAAGIGKVTAELFAEEGASVLCCDVAEEELEKTVSGIKEGKNKAMAFRCNVADDAEARAMIKTAVDTWGRIDILINNAGITRDQLTPRMSEQDWDLVMDVNLKGTFLCSKHALRKMKKGSKIVNTASISTLGNKGQSNYSASKMGVIGLTRTQALEYASKKICINAIAPGAIATPMLEEVSEEARKAMLDAIPLGEYIQPIEIARAHLFLASDEANFITGQCLFVDGGMSVGI